MTVVHPMNLTIETGEVVVLLGPSICGKTTVLVTATKNPSLVIVACRDNDDVI